VRAILTYHSIDPSGSAISVDARVFRRHVEWLASGSVGVGGIRDVLETPPNQDCVALTFDDGFVNFATVAWPLLRDRGLPVTLFVVTDYVGRANDWEGVPGVPVARLPLLSWDALAQLAEEGVELGSHGCTHRPLDRLHPAHVEEELDRAAETIRARTGTKPRVFAYPYGAVTEPIAGRVAARYQYGCTTELRALGAREEASRLPRLDAYYFRSAASLARWGTVGQRAQLWLRRQGRRMRRRGRA